MTEHNESENTSQAAEPREPETVVDDRSAIAKGASVASQIIGAAASLGVLAWAGYWLDQRIGILGPFTTLGALLGGAVFFWQMLTLAKGKTASPRSGNQNRR